MIGFRVGVFSCDVEVSVIDWGVHKDRGMCVISIILRVVHKYSYLNFQTSFPASVVKLIESI